MALTCDRSEAFHGMVGLSKSRAPGIRPQPGLKFTADRMLMVYICANHRDESAFHPSYCEGKEL